MNEVELFALLAVALDTASPPGHRMARVSEYGHDAAGLARW